MKLLIINEKRRKDRVILESRSLFLDVIYKYIIKFYP